MKNLLLPLFLALAWAPVAIAQTALVIPACNTAGYTTGTQQLTQNPLGNLCVNAAVSVSASISGFTPGGTYATPLSVSGTSANVALPAGATVVVYNTGSVAAFTKLGTSNAVTATTADDQIAPGGWMSFTVGSNTFLAAITASSTTALNISGGTGLATGAGGGASGGGSGGTSSSYGSTFPLTGTAIGLTDGTNMISLKGSATLGAFANIAGWDGVALGAPSAYGTSPGAVNVPGVNAFITNAPAVTLNAGSAIIGKIDIDQTTPGTTNGVVVNSGTVTANPGSRTLVALDIATVTTGGTAVTALNSGHRTAGGWIQNPPSATINLCINEIGTASGTTSAGSTTCIQPGQTYALVPAAGAVSVISSDSSHPFSGEGLQ